ncbi:MAG: tryptophan synthase subunit alpha [Veillonellaceae bacterium]|jgi:tryptophan synthase alpha chain|nr:tryptophan synthase subunit alpha [Veillonellaceae bacterium]
MSRINATLANLKAQGRKGLIAYVTAGCPDYLTTLDAVEKLQQAGADIVEIGIPFSDPMADGPIIQRAAAMALKSGASTSKTRKLIKNIRTKSDIPLVVMTYINTILNYGVDEFVKNFADAGIDGIIVPDLPLEECTVLESACQQNSIDLIHFAAPTTTSDRIVSISHKASGFLYCISNTGVTGVRDVDYEEINTVISLFRQHSKIPAAIGFGIGNPKTAVLAARQADAVIVGSAIMTKLMDEGVNAAAQLVADIRQALDKEYV